MNLVSDECQWLWLPHLLVSPPQHNQSKRARINFYTAVSFRMFIRLWCFVAHSMFSAHLNGVHSDWLTQKTNIEWLSWNVFWIDLLKCVDEKGPRDFESAFHWIQRLFDRWRFSKVFLSTRLNRIFSRFSPITNHFNSESHPLKL